MTFFDSASKNKINTSSSFCHFDREKRIKNVLTTDSVLESASPVVKVQHVTSLFVRIALLTSEEGSQIRLPVKIGQNDETRVCSQMLFSNSRLKWINRKVACVYFQVGPGERWPKVPVKKVTLSAPETPWGHASCVSVEAWTKGAQ